MAAPADPRTGVGDSRGASLELAGRLLLLALLLEAPAGWAWQVPTGVLAAAGLALPGLVRSGALWSAAAAVLGARLVSIWPHADNHDYLAAYACLAFACALGGPTPEATLARAARWLLGFCFAFAVLWKAVLSPDFASGEFFRAALLFDPRFEPLALLAGGITPEQVAANAAFAAGEGGALFEPTRLVALARAAALWTLALETALAVAFLWPGDRGPGRARDALLLGFCATTFAPAPVPGFGWVLLALGAAQCAPPRRAARAAYLLCAGLVLVHARVPWLAALARACASP